MGQDKIFKDSKGKGISTTQNFKTSAESSTLKGISQRQNSKSYQTGKGHKNKQHVIGGTEIFVSTATFADIPNMLPNENIIATFPLSNPNSSTTHNTNNSNFTNSTTTNTSLDSLALIVAGNSAQSQSGTGLNALNTTTLSSINTLSSHESALEKFKRLGTNLGVQNPVFFFYRCYVHIPPYWY